MACLSDFLAADDAVIRVRITAVRGSSPREAGAEMLVSPAALHGTIGGGQLEYMAIDRARAMLSRGTLRSAMDVPLGPEIGQCCGGRVVLSLEHVTETVRARLQEADAARRAARPEVYVLGAGHVGRALASLLQQMPVRAMLIDSRRDALALCDARIEKRRTPLPEAEIRAARPLSAFVVLTHDHALDFLLAAEALRRGDAAYVGLIGSATKRAKFTRFCADGMPDIEPASLVCPIGGTASRDKRPEIIAALTLAEIMAALTRSETTPALDAKTRLIAEGGEPK